MSVRLTHPGRGIFLLAQAFSNSGRSDTRIFLCQLCVQNVPTAATILPKPNDLLGIFAKESICEADHRDHPAAKLEAVKQALTEVEVFRLTVLDCQDLAGRKARSVRFADMRML